jgi:hypothetical protein
MNLQGDLLVNCQLIGPIFNPDNFIFWVFGRFSGQPECTGVVHLRLFSRLLYKKKLSKNRSVATESHENLSHLPSTN